MNSLNATFKGTTDEKFTNGATYRLIDFKDNSHNITFGYIETWFINNNGGISYIPYSNLSCFNRNWKL